jgi:hypothetical protein
MSVTPRPKGIGHRPAPAGAPVYDADVSRTR